jgi:dihydroorotase
MRFFEKDGISYCEMLRPNDFHVHLREISQLEDLVPYSAQQFGHVMAMPNLKKALINVADATHYAIAIQAEGQLFDFQCHVALYLTDSTTTDEIRLAQEKSILAVKLYPGGATTNSSSGVTDIYNMWSIFEFMEKIDMPLSVHCENIDPGVDFFEREREFIETLEDIVIDFPELRIVFEHVSTKEGVQFVKNMPQTVVATITAHHMLINRNDLLASGVCPSKFCFPVVNHREDQKAVISAAISGDPKFFLGTDSAPHMDFVKFKDGGCGGCFTSPYAMGLYAEAFERAEEMEKLENFASIFGSEFYKLPKNTTTIRLKREPSVILEKIYTLCNGEQYTPFMAGEILQWQYVE